MSGGKFGNEKFDNKDTTEKFEQAGSNSASVTGYGARPLEVAGGMTIILKQRRGECKDCKWHPYVCQHCEVSHLEDERIEKEMAP